MALAFIFDSVGAGEWLVLLAVLLVVIGPRRLPSTIRAFGNHYAKFRRAAESFKRQIMEMDTEFERAVDAAAREAEEAARIPGLEETPEASEHPEYPETPEHPEYPETPEYPEYTETPEYPENPEAPEHSEFPGTPEAPEVPAEAKETDGDRTPQES